MKKIFIAILAVAALASCATDEIVSTPKGAAIGFGDTFVDNAVRANDLVAGYFDFSVYGSVVNSQNQAGMIFTNQQVAADGTYSPVQYWIAAADYDFVAIAPYTGAAWTYAPTVSTVAENGTITFDNETAAANQDLLFAYVEPDTTDAKIETAPAKVGFTFDHMLSRVKFTFANGFASNGNIKLEVKDVTITDVYATADLAIAHGIPAAAWTNFGATFSKNFGQVGGATLAALTEGTSASTEHFYLIPANKAYNVTFTVVLYQAGVELDTYSRTATIPATEMKIGHSYDIKTTLKADNTSDDGQLFPIEFQVTGVNGWANEGNYEGVDANVNTPAQGNN